MRRSVVRAVVVLPVAVASGFWSVQLAGPTPAPPAGSSLSQAVAEQATGPVLPDHHLGTGAIEAPASVSPRDDVRSATDGRFVAVSSRPVAGDVPAVALAAYQRAENLIASADRDCRLSWQLIAAIARIESDHGRFGGASVGDDGVSRPAIIGPALDGDDGTARVLDTDAGLLDRDDVLDRAVGPLQFIPSTWSVVGVDGDADGTRDPQDVDDAALAAAVYLCSGDDDLATRAGQRTAVFRYNHSTAYVDAVLATMDDYLAGNDVAPALVTARAGYLAPTPLVPLAGGGGGGRDGGGGVAGGSLLDGPRGAAISEVREPRDAAVVAVDPDPSTEPAPPPAVEPTPVEAPTPTEGPTEGPTEEPTEEPAPTEEPTEEPEPTDEPVPSAEAAALCAEEGHVDDPEVDDDDFDVCLLEHGSEEPDDGGVASQPGPVTAPREQPAARRD
jgi:membrane-bound lytic murein transglycosylase B